ncbi:MAG: hypothetical protein ACREUP_09350 [Burkholderiales bacterium]
MTTPSTPDTPSSVQEIVSLMMPYVAACVKFNNTPRDGIGAADAEVTAAMGPLKTALDALVEERDRLRFELDGVNAMAKLKKREPLSEFQRMQIIGDEFPLPLVQTVVIQKIDAICMAIERAHGIGTTQSEVK